MPRLRVAALSVLVSACSGSSDEQPQRPGASPADSIVAACIARDTSTAWQRMSATWSDERLGWRNDSLRRVLLEMAVADQAVRRSTGLADSMKSPAFARRMAERDSVGLVRLRDIVRRFGWPTKSMVGARGASAAFLIAQHNAPIQPEALRLMLALPPGEVNPSELAMLQDRLLAHNGRPQKYATQLKPVTGDTMEFYPIDSVSRVDARRAAVGLPPMPIYLCMMQGFEGRSAKYPP